MDDDGVSTKIFMSLQGITTLDLCHETIGNDTRDQQEASRNKSWAVALAPAVVFNSLSLFKSRLRWFSIHFHFSIHLHCLTLPCHRATTCAIHYVTMSPRSYLCQTPKVLEARSPPLPKPSGSNATKKSPCKKST